MLIDFIPFRTKILSTKDLNLAQKISCQMQCLVCKRTMGSSNLKKINIYSCKYCKKFFANSINYLYHELHYTTREAGDVSYRDDFQSRAGRNANGDFEKSNMTTALQKE